jgi:hypothetical protein
VSRFEGLGEFLRGRLLLMWITVNKMLRVDPQVVLTVSTRALEVYKTKPHDCERICFADLNASANFGTYASML